MLFVDIIVKPENKHHIKSGFTYPQKAELSGILKNLWFFTDSQQGSNIPFISLHGYKRNKLLIIIFILLIFVFGTFHIINISNHGYELYNPVPAVNGYTSNHDELHYPPGFRDVIDGHYIVRSPQVKEYKNSVSHTDIFPYFVLGFPAAVLGVGVKEIFIVSDFIFPAFGFVLLYLLMRRVFRIDKYLSVLFSLLATLFQSFTVFVLGLSTLSSFNFLNAVDALGQAKLYAPEFLFIPFMLAIIVLYYSFKKDGYLYPALTIILGTVLVYSYIFYSTFYWTTFVLLSIYTLYSNRHNIIPPLKKILFISIPSSVLSVPYFLEFMAFKNLEAYPEILLRAGVETGRFIHLPLIFAVVSIIFIVISYKVMYKKDKFSFYFLSSMFVSTILWSNIQIITGFNVQPFHWTYRISEILYFIAAAYILQDGYQQLKNSGKNNIFLQSGKKVLKPIFGFFNDKKVVYILIAFYIIYGLGYSASAAINTGDIYVFDKDELRLYDWLNQNTEKDSVVLTLSIDQNIKVSSYAHNNVYLPGGLFSGLTTEEIVDRIIFLYDIYNVSDAELEEKLNVPNDAVRKQYIDQLYKGKRFSLSDFEKYYFIVYPFSVQFFYGKWDYQHQNPDNSGWIGYYFPSEFREYVMNKRHNKSYNIYEYDYILIGPYEKQIADTAMIENNFERIFSNNGFRVFKRLP